MRATPLSFYLLVSVGGAQFQCPCDIIVSETIVGSTPNFYLAIFIEEYLSSRQKLSQMTTEKELYRKIVQSFIARLFLVLLSDILPHTVRH